MDIDGVKKAAADWEQKAKDAEALYAKKLETMQYETAAKTFVDTLKPKDDLSNKLSLANF